MSRFINLCMKSKLHHTSLNTSGIYPNSESNTAHSRVKEFYFILFLLVLMAGPVSLLEAQTQISGNLTTYVDNFISSMPSTYANNDYQAPSVSNLNTWGNAILYIMQGNYASAQLAADSIGYRVVAYTNTATSPNNLFYVLEKKSTSTNYWGMFIYNPSATRRKLFIQSPHPKYDSNTGKQGFYIFLNNSCIAFYLSGTHRCNSSSASPCDGTSSVCTGTDEAYRLSDQAHNISTLQKATEVFYANVTNLIVIQAHGFSQDTGDPDAIMSNGTRTTPSPDYLTLLKNNLLLLDDTLTFKIMHKDLTWTKLAATDNTQGRLLNGSDDPCETAASTGTGRFLHIEQAYTLRDNDADRKKLSDAIGMTFGVDSIALVTPNGNQTLTAGSSYSITWTSSGVISNVKIEYTVDNGTTWKTITSSTSNTGSYSWTVPNVGTWRGKVRIINVDDTSIGDTSSASFKISCAVYPTTGTTSFADPAAAFGSRLLDGVYDFHRGMDFAGAYNTPIHPALPGVIVRLEDSSVTAGTTLQRSGNWILVKIDSAAGQPRHNAYLHLNGFYKYKVGDTVSTADTIGFMGKSGYQINTVHCHFELYKNLSGTSIDKDKAQNPLEILPYTNGSSSSVSFITRNDSTAIVVSTPDTELDFDQIAIYGETASRTVGFNSRTGIDPDNNDNPAYSNVLIDPDAFVQDSSVQRIRFWVKNSEIGMIDSVRITDIMSNSFIASQYSLGPRYAVTTGNWDGAIWASTSGGVAGSATVPISLNSVTINSGVTVTVNISNAECNSVSFGATTAKLSFASGSILNVYGDFTLASTTHNAITSWVSGAKIRFTGSASTQTLSGWSTSAFSTGFNEVVVDKTAGKVVTSGTGMRFQLGTTLDVVNGTFELAATDAIEGRNYAGTAAAPNIIVETGAVFNMAQTASATGSFIRKASNTADETSKIGSLTVYGTAYLASSVSKGINFTGMTIGSGGFVQFPTSRGIAASSVNSGAITINSGGTLKNSVTTSLWYANSTTPVSITVNSGGVYEISSSATVLPSGGITQNSGSAIKFSSDISATLPAGISTYKTLILSGSGTKSLNVNTTISEALQLSGSFTTLSLGSYTLTYSASAKLRYGASGQTTAQTTTSIEWPASNGPQNVEIYNSGGVTLHAARTISGVLTLSGGLLFIGANTLTLGSSSSISGTPDATKMIVTNGTGKVVKSILNGATLPYSFTFPIGDSTGTSDYSPVAVSLTSGTFSSASIGALVVNSKHAQNTSSSDYIKRYWTLTANGITSPQYTAACSYVTGDVVGNESSLSGGLYSSSAWTPLGAVSSHTITATNKSSFGDITAGIFSTTGYVKVKVIPQGFYNTGDYLNASDTLELYLASATTPYSFVDSSSALLDSTTFYATGAFNSASTGSYYLSVKHRNSVETWSAGTISFVQNSTVTYDFTDLQTRAYGDNLTQVNSSPVRWAVFSGDVNQDGYVDPLDLSLIDADSYNYVSGRALATDINGDGYVDPLDLAITDANSYNYVGIKRPVSAKLMNFYMSRRFKEIYDSTK